jgi:hypothetical protein
MRPSYAFRFLALALFLAATAGCDDTPTSVDRRDPQIRATCVPLGDRVSCTAALRDVPTAGSVRDVTKEATWRVSDPSLGSFTEPGVFTPVRRGEAEITVSYQGLQDRLTSWFLVDPGQPARRLYWVSGIVRDETTNAPLPGATVEILDGYAKGKRAVTNEFGHYQIDSILTGEPFRIRAAKEGYAPSTLSYRVDSPIGPPGGNPPFLDFKLRRDG